MMTAQHIGRAMKWTAGGAGLVALGYAATAAVTWLRYGHPAPARGADADPLLDRFMPSYDVVDRHAIHVNAPADVTLCAAADADLQESGLLRGIFKARALMLGGRAEAMPARGLLARVKAMGWGTLAEEPGREIVMGAATQPWKADVVFRAVPPEAFAAFQEPDYVKIVWTLRADPDGPTACVLRTETRVATTDPRARSRFRWYWARFSPGIVLIRRVLLRSTRSDAEGRVRRVMPARISDRE